MKILRKFDTKYFNTEQNVIILITALTTRTYFDVCILYLKHDIEKYKKKYKNEGILRAISNYRKKLFKKVLGFDISLGAFEILSIIIIYRIYRLFGKCCSKQSVKAGIDGKPEKISIFNISIWLLIIANSIGIYLKAQNNDIVNNMKTQIIDYLN